MKIPYRNEVSLLAIGLLIAFTPALAGAQTGSEQPGPPPISAPLVREGDLAIQLNAGLDIGQTDDEVEAENRLADVGISPKNGWIADYPVTPDIIGELQQAIGDAADADKISFDREEALRRFNNVLSESGLSISPYPPAGGNEPPPSASANYPNPTVVNNYYYSEGPPVVTYYTPPPDFYYLYAWVPSPFWCSGFWFPGFFVLHDFHKTVIVRRRPVFVSNHFRDVRVHRVFRIDPADRFTGRTFGGIGASPMRGRLSTGIPGGERRIFNNPPPRNVPRVLPAPPRLPGERMVTPPRSIAPIPTPRAGSTTSQPRSGAAAAPRSRDEMKIPPSRSTPPVAAAAPAAGRAIPSPRSGATTAQPRNEAATPPPTGGEAGHAPARGSGSPPGREIRR